MSLRPLMVAWLALGCGCIEMNPSFQRDLEPSPDQRGSDEVPGADGAPGADGLIPFQRQSEAGLVPPGDLGLPDAAGHDGAGPPDLAGLDGTGPPDAPPPTDAGAPDAFVPDADPCLGLTCTAPHATGTCVGGVCQSYQCDPGWGDCNGSMTDGCEIPVGVPDSCGPSGLSSFSAAAGATPGCGTAYCGTGGPGAASFGTWHCSFCAHCAKFVDGYAWCIPGLGTYSPQRCTSCCNTSDPKYPAVCQP